MRSNRGLTLIELLIALAIGSIIAIGTFRLFNASVTTRDTLTLQTEEITQLSRALKVIEQDFLQLAPMRQVKDAYGDYEAAISLNYDGLQITRNGWAVSPVMRYERSTLQRVRYSLEEEGSESCPWLESEESEETQYCLVRSYRAHLDDNGDLTWYNQMLLRPVKSLEWRFLVYSEISKNSDYQSEPPEVNRDTGEMSGINMAVELTLTSGTVQKTNKRLIATPRQAVAEEEDDS